MKNILIREEKPTDYNAVKSVNDKAFKQPVEGNIIEKLRYSDSRLLSLVAEMNNTVVGHIFFSSVTIDEHPYITDGMGLAPMAVLPKYQKQGIGKLLINKGIEILQKQSIPFIIVLGHETYYPKFGFEIASKYGLKCQWDGVPDEAFMVLILDKDRMKNVNGIARYREEWNEAV